MPDILIVDDDTALLQALPEALRLRMSEVNVEISDSAPAALQRIASTDYDAIVSDIKMPGMDGLALLQRIRSLRPATPTLLITGHGEHDLAIQALRGGAYDFIQKPIDRDYFIASLGRAIQMRQLSRQVEQQRLALERHASSLEQVVQERTRELREANQAKDEFLSIASHELKTPLTTLKTITHLTRRAFERQDGAVPDYFVRMDRAIRRMQTLIDDLFDTSRIQSGKLALRLEPCDVVALCRQTIDEQVATTGRTITLEAPERAVEVNVDADRLDQVLTNLLGNALKYSPASEAVTVVVGPTARDVRIGVRDHGPGIPPEQLPYLFERFYRVPGISVQSGSGVGLGLGLYICREIVERHGGHIWAESLPGDGSTFWVALPPLASRPAPTTGPAPAAITRPLTAARRQVAWRNGADTSGRASERSGNAGGHLPT
ncbi:MAG TPA: hybrid sensor histidine kinase/response regulator [Ktedonobacterales bacterium]|jgi:signal transduction histidine kinase|nr:hybrid sensor histidine kinase/response regulator [Ktedonobacterales bacterium]